MDTHRDGLLACLEAFIVADTWNESHDIVNEHPDLLTDEADAVLAELVAAAPQQEIRSILDEHRRLLARCREMGVDEAFAQKMATIVAEESTTENDGVLDDIPLSDTTAAALRLAAAQLRLDALLDTKLVFAALPRVDIDAGWDRLALHTPPPDALARADFEDPHHGEGDTWDGVPLTGSLATALRLGVRIADAYDLSPAPPAVLALALVADPRTSAACALLEGSDLTHADLIQLIEEILGDRLEGVSQFLNTAVSASTPQEGHRSQGLPAERRDRPDHAQQTAIDEFEEFDDLANALADRFETLVDIVNEFLRASTVAELGRLLDEHPEELLSYEADRLLADRALHLRERRQLIADYRATMRDRVPSAEGERADAPAREETGSGSSAGSSSREEPAKEVREGLSDRFDGLQQVLDEFIRASTPPESERLLNEHAELLAPEVDTILDELAHHSEERRQLIADYRAIMRDSVPAEGERAEVPAHEQTASEGSAGSRSPLQRNQVGECTLEAHVWESSTLEESGYQATALRCGVCHVGHLIEWTTMPDGAVKADYCIFPADGNIDVSQEIRIRSVLMCDSTISEMQDDGVRVIRGIPVIGGPRPSALGKHTQFVRLH